MTQDLRLASFQVAKLAAPKTKDRVSSKVDFATALETPRLPANAKPAVARTVTLPVEARLQAALNDSLKQPQITGQIGIKDGKNSAETETIDSDRENTKDQAHDQDRVQDDAEKVVVVALPAYLNTREIPATHQGAPRFFEAKESATRSGADESKGEASKNPGVNVTVAITKAGAAQLDSNGKSQQANTDAKTQPAHTNVESQPANAKVKSQQANASSKPAQASNAEPKPLDPIATPAPAQSAARASAELPPQGQIPDGQNLHPSDSNEKLAVVSVKQQKADAPPSQAGAQVQIIATAPTTAPAQSIIDGISTEPSWGAYFRDTGPSSAQPIKSLKIQLHPAELGTVTAHIRAAGDTLEIEITADTIEAHKHLAADADEILRSLRQVGIDVDKISVQLADNRPNSANAPNPEWRNFSSFQGQDRRDGAPERRGHETGGNVSDGNFAPKSSDVAANQSSGRYI